MRRGYKKSLFFLFTAINIFVIFTVASVFWYIKKDMGSENIDTILNYYAWCRVRCRHFENMAVSLKHRAEYSAVSRFCSTKLLAASLTARLLQPAVCEVIVWKICRTEIMYGAIDILIILLLVAVYLWANPWYGDWASEEIGAIYSKVPHPQKKGVEGFDRCVTWYSSIHRSVIWNI